MATSRVTVKLTRPLADFVARITGPDGLYGRPGEYVRDLIRRDMEERTGQAASAAILDGYRDRAIGAVFTSSGDFATDLLKLERGAWDVT